MTTKRAFSEDVYSEVEDIKSGKGKRHHQKIKPYAVLQYLLKYADEDHVASANKIVSYLQEHGINAERRSVCDDIQEINRIAIMVEEDCSIKEAAAILKAEGDDRRLVVYDAHKKGFYVARRDHDFYEYQLLAECVYASKFVTSKQSKDLVEIICGLLSEHKAVKLKKEIFVLDRVKTNNKNILANFACIEDAMSVSIDGVPHTPEKIRFKYLQYQMGMLDQQIERRKGNWYTVSPFKLMISEGNYYLMAVNEKGKMFNYRLDRMRNIQPTGESREGEEVFAEVDLRTYPQRVFNMYRGKEEQVVIRFIPPLLDTFVERFGTKGISPCGKDYLMIRTYVEVSDQFFGWLLGFGRRVKLLESTGTAVEEFKAYLDKVRDMYE